MTSHDRSMKKHRLKLLVLTTRCHWASQRASRIKWNQKMAVFSVRVPRNLAKVHRRLTGAFRLHHHGPDDGNKKNIRNSGKLVPDYTTQQPTRQSTSHSSP